MRPMDIKEGSPLDPEHTYLLLEDILLNSNAPPVFEAMTSIGGADLYSRISHLSHNKAKSIRAPVLLWDFDNRAFYSLIVTLDKRRVQPIEAAIENKYIRRDYSDMTIPRPTALQMLMDVPVEALPKYLETFKHSPVLHRIVLARLEGVL